MQLTQNFKRRNVAYARYQRALLVLALFPASVWYEANSPSLARAAGVVLAGAGSLLSGWMYREAIRWWTGDDSEPAPAPEFTPPPPAGQGFRGWYGWVDCEDGFRAAVSYCSLDCMIDASDGDPDCRICRSERRRAISSSRARIRALAITSSDVLA